MSFSPRDVFAVLLFALGDLSHAQIPLEAVPPYGPWNPLPTLHVDRVFPAQINRLPLILCADAMSHLGQRVIVGGELVSLEDHGDESLCLLVNPATPSSTVGVVIDSSGGPAAKRMRESLRLHALHVAVGTL